MPGSMEISEQIWKIKKQMNPTEIYEHSGKHAPMIAYFILKLHWKFTKGRNTKEKSILTIWDASFLYKTVGMPMDASISAHDLHTGRNMQKEHKPDSW
jgi:hypothetical protein